MYYDVVDMDACQLQFGRPWQYDLDAQNVGKENVYRLEKNGVKFTLLPLRWISGLSLPLLTQSIRWELL